MNCGPLTFWCGKTATCRVCYLMTYSPRHRRIWGIEEPHAVRPGDVRVAGSFLSIPTPPPLTLTPRSKIALVTVAAGAAGRRLLAASGPSMRRYAQRIGADFVALDWPGHPDWPMSAKFAIASTLDHYERIAYVDADVLLRPTAVNLFDLCEPHEFGACDELPFHRRSPKFGLEASYNQFRERMGFDASRASHYFNAGVMVVPRSHRAVIEAPRELWLPDRGVGRHCAEQHLANARLVASGLPFRLIDRRGNFQSWTPGFDAAPDDAVLHWSGAGSARVHRADQIAAVAERHPWPFELPTARDPAWSIDRRHVHWIRDTLRSGRFRRVLEIGSYQGYSTAALLDAVTLGEVDRVDLCEPHPTPELERLLAGYQLGDRVTLHRCDTAELLARPWGGWDLVVVDGDHRAAAVEIESQALLAAGVRAVFAHDTRATEAGHANCQGPPLLATAFRAAGYLHTEDARHRAGEATERGLFFAARTPPDFAAGLTPYLAHCDAPVVGPVFGVGAEKTGTHSLAAMLSLPHQPDESRAIAAILDRGDKAAVVRDLAGGAVSNLLVHLLPELLAAYPDARFVLTIRDPEAWLRSALNHAATRDGTPEWSEIDRLRGKADCNVEGSLRYWEWHNQTVLDTIPADRLLVVRTAELSTPDGAASVQQFARRPATPAHEFRGEYTADPLAGRDVAALVAELCPTWVALSPPEDPQPASKSKAKRPKAPPGPGSHLKALLKSLGFTGALGCGCEAMAADMDRWGVAGCRRHRGEIEARLRAKAKEVGWGAKLAAGVRAAAGGLLLNPLDPVPGLLDEALRRAGG